ncbi:gamma-glutamyl-gamma-aminobutyrate hydrolase family protein [Paeniglutamicibacter cryotolerans]|uniref:Putative glutamine amidotransferase n=1 Tax=Paeniglutamicibacter cryotolerans TaxID=670079 RepID=A0A839QJY8_9MICC|nr:gamma-glutamyl-gamma-aminobutyrate hydrolase family protein [Paeniglutamicibacter cryotolerans]MBB2994346.1 putative glutamine amidotransferase [Paeniglutamicibacter cryotolerans]
MTTAQRPVIALTTPLHSTAYSRDYIADLDRLAAQACAGIEAAGGRALLFDSSGSSIAPDATELLDIARIDGVVLLGGGDVDPAHYGSPGHPDAVRVDSRADALELALIAAARAARLPVLGICRGLQLINIAFGGSLITDLGPDSAHKDHSPESAMVGHQVMVVPGTVLRTMLGAPVVEVRSSHHQGVEELGEGLIVSALADDGIVEGIEVPAQEGGEWVVAVQWHPEDALTEPGQLQALFGALVSESARRQEARLAVA